MKSKFKYSKQKLKRTLKNSKDKAKAYLDDDKKMEELFDRFERKLKKIPSIGKYLADVAVLMSMIRAYAKHEYTKMPLETILIAIAGIIYVVNPLDLIPDAIPGAGYVDDAAAVTLILGWLHEDIKDYKAWRETNK